MDDLTQMNLAFLYMNLLIVLAMGIMLAILPYITRQSLLFGIRVPEAARELPAVRRMKRVYAIWILAATLILLGATLVQYRLWPDLSLLASLYLPLLMLPVQLAVYIPLWKRAAALKREQGWAIPAVGTAETRSARARERFSSLPWAWYIGSAALSVLAILASLAAWPQVPDVVVTHWNAAMQADAWTAKSIGHILVMPILTLVMTVFMLVCNLFIYRMKLQVSQENPALSFAQHRVYRRLLSHVLGLITVCISLMFLVLQPMMLNLWIPGAGFMLGFMLIPTTVMIIPPILLSIKAGQSGNKLHPAITEADVAAAGYPQATEGARRRQTPGDDRFWKLGMFYYNPEDPALLVEDRFGNNGGLNYARPAALILAGLLLLLVLAVYIGSTILLLQLL